jgi:hypothetical protein
VEETSFRAKSVEGVGTSTTAFVGPTRKGSVAIGVPQPNQPAQRSELLTSFGDFVRIFGGLGNLNFGATSTLNYLAHGVLHYFNEGGSRLYVSRVNIGGTGASSNVVGTGANAGTDVRWLARFPGALGNGTITVRQIFTQATLRTMSSAPEGTLLRVRPSGPTSPPSSPPGSPPSSPATPTAPGADSQNFHSFVKTGTDWIDQTSTKLALAGDPPSGSALFVSLLVTAQDADGEAMIYEDMGFDPKHPRYIGNILSPNPSRRSDALNNLYCLFIGANVTAFGLFSGLFPSADPTKDFTVNSFNLVGGSDGSEPVLGDVTTAGTYAAALEEIRKLEDVAIIAAPGHTAYADRQAIQGALIDHVEHPRAYRIAVLDTRPNLTPSQALEDRSRIDSKYAALYFPWVTTANPLARPGAENVPREINLPPSAFLCGIYARNDAEQSVAKTPANEVVLDALRFESDINFAQNQLLNPSGINCLRFFPGRSYRVWGGRLASSDPEWKYVNVRRYFIYLEHSIDNGTQWAVFENNGERLWANIRETIEAFLYNEWVSGNLLGSTPKEAFFVRCDRSTMTQNDLDNGRLICLIGVAVLKPAEFVIFRIGQKTADARS